MNRLENFFENFSRWFHNHDDDGDGFTGFTNQNWLIENESCLFVFFSLSSMFRSSILMMTEHCVYCIVFFRFKTLWLFIFVLILWFFALFINLFCLCTLYNEQTNKKIFRIKKNSSFTNLMSKYSIQIVFK